jgi:hypothetical protein
MTVADKMMNDSEHNARESACGEGVSNQDADAGTSTSAPEDPAGGLEDLSPDAAGRIRLFMAESTIRGGASPADVADLYTSQEVMDDDGATAYLDRRFVRGEVLADWREFQDGLSMAHFDGPPAASAEALLARVQANDARTRVPRSIFDDPEEDEFDEEDRGARLEDRDPNLADLAEDARTAIERFIVSDVLCYGIAPYRVMQLREERRVLGDERSLQYLDLPFEIGNRPADWDRLRDQALMTRARLESLGIDPSAAYKQADGHHPDLPVGSLLHVIEEQAQQH